MLTELDCDRFDRVNRRGSLAMLDFRVDIASLPLTEGRFELSPCELLVLAMVLLRLKVLASMMDAGTVYMKRSAER